MPTYDYRCNACGHLFEEFQTMSEPELKKCPECKKNKLERLIGGGAGFLFKGTGYYQTDYRSKSYTDAKKAESASGDSSSKDSSSKDSGSSSSAPKKDAKQKPD